MTQATDTDIREIKDLITAGNAATQRQISELAISTQKQISDLDKKIDVGLANIDTKFATLREEMNVGFEKIDGRLDGINDRLVAVESSNKTIDGRLWSLIATLLGLTVTALLGIFVRYLFSHDSIL
jgi:predicted PurR-regulated permease PerM